MQTINNFNFEGKKVLVRVDFNVPLNDQFEVTDKTRITAAIPTIKKILNDGGSVILMSHMGRPKGEKNEKYSLKHILSALETEVGQKVSFAEDCIGAAAEEKALQLKNGEILLLENLRFHNEEEKGDENFAKALASLGDFYVNDAFGTAHRRHASTAVIAEFFPNNKSLGLLMGDEVANISKVMNDVQKPYTAIIGGAKVSSKIGIIKNLASKVDNFIIGGGMVFTFAKALGGKVGNSLVEDEMLQDALEILEYCKSLGVKVYLPVDSLCTKSFSNDDEKAVFNTNEIPDGWMGLDIGPKAMEELSAVLAASKTILWNGPMGVFEMSSFEEGTKTIGNAVAEATKKGAFSLVGGGDSVAAVNKFNLEENISYVSTGGGALLEFMEGIILPGIAAIEN